MNWHRFWRDDGGNMAILFAVGFTLSAMVSAVAVDAAALYHERRQLQAGVDLAAISAAGDPRRAAEIAQSVLVEARLLAPASTEGLTVVIGHYDPTKSNIAARFEPNAEPVNAVSVALDRVGTLHFAGHFAPPPSLSARGIAAAEPEVSFTLGSRLASLNGGIANALLSRLLGTAVSLSVMDYTALVGAKVEAFALLDALATRLGVTAGTYDELLALEAPAGTLAAALADVTSGAASGILNTIAGGGSGQAVPLGQLLDLGRLGGLDIDSRDAVADISLSAMEVLSAAAVLADGNRQLSLSLGAGLPGLVSLGLDMALGEPAQGGGWFAIGPRGTVIRTAQLRLRLSASLLGGSTLLGAGVNVPTWLELANAEARIANASCPTDAHPNGTAVVDVRPGLLRLAVGKLDNHALYDFGHSPTVAPTSLVDALLLKVSGSALAQMAAETPTRLSFSSADIANGQIKKAATTSAVSSLTGSLFSNLNLTVNVLGIGLASPAIIAQTVRNLLVPLAPTLDMAVNSVASTLGLGLGEADVRVLAVRCSRAVLVG